MRVEDKLVVVVGDKSVEDKLTVGCVVDGLLLEDKSVKVEDKLAVVGCRGCWGGFSDGLLPICDFKDSTVVTNLSTVASRAFILFPYS